MWRAHDCVERARAAIAAALEEEQNHRPADGLPWVSLDSVVARSLIVAATPCRLELRATGTTVDVNAADDEMLRRVFRAAGVVPARADSMTDALLDWRDADDVPRRLGAERTWYTVAERSPPRNGALASVREIALVRGFEGWPALNTILGVEAGRIFLARAPLPVIAGLPGIGEEALGRIVERRARGAASVELLTLAAELSAEARATLVARYAELARLTTPEPDAWILRSREEDASSSVTAAVEVWLVRAGSRAAVVRRRGWVE
jgi:hypothetical protein